MSATHPRALRAFGRRVSMVLTLRCAVQWVVLWFCVWGVVILVARFTGWGHRDWLVAGILGFLPLVIFAGVREHLRRPPFLKLRATYDRLNACGGVMMAEEVSDMTVWYERLSPAVIPALRWHSGKSMLMLGAAALFLAVALLVPERFARLGRARPLEIGQIVQDLQVEVEALKEEKIIEEKKAEDLHLQLSQMEKRATGLDPGKTWEALDHIKESNTEAARQAAEEASSKMTELAQAETLANALTLAAEMGMSSDTANRGAQELAAMINSAKIEEGLLKGRIPAELLSGLTQFNKEEMEALLKSLAFNKSSLSNTVARLAKLKLIDPALLAKCNKAGQCRGCKGLAEYLSSCTNACESICAVATCYGRGGVTRGRGDAPMTWTDGASEEGAKFKEEALPPATQLSDAQVVGLSRAAPELSADDVTAASGALLSAAGSGGSAHSQIILPRHRPAVQRFFKREGQ